MTPRAFDRLVEHALAELPAEFRARLDNVGIDVERRPSRELREMGVPRGETLLGLFSGPARGEGGGFFAAPE